LDAVKKLAASALPQNRRYLENYTGADGLANVRVILDSVYMNNLDYHGFDKHEFHKLGELRKERMKADIKYMKERLSKPKYQLDSVEAVAGVMNTNRLEVVRIPVMSLPMYLLKHIDPAHSHLNLATSATPQKDFNHRKNKGLVRAGIHRHVHQLGERLCRVPFQDQQPHRMLAATTPRNQDAT
jgi:hypothetical protein